MARKEYDNYITDIGLARWAVRHAMELCHSDPNGEKTILEPCCGDTAPFATAGREYGLVPYGFDIRAVNPELWTGVPDDEKMKGICVDNFDIEVFPHTPFPSVAYDIVATNPPFVSGERVVRISLDFLKPGGIAVFLTKMAFMSTQSRTRLFLERPPAEVWILRARPSFTGDGATDVAQEYAFIFWYGTLLDQMNRRFGGRTTLHWLDNSKMMERKKVRVAKQQD